MRRLLVGGVAAALCGLLVLPALFGGPGAGDTAMASARAQRDIPPDLLAVYQAAAASCSGLDWEVLAAVGWVESHHADGRADPATGDVRPPIYGPPLDGRDGRGR